MSKSLYDVDFSEILSKSFEELTEEEKMILALKQAINEAKNDKDNEFLGTFIVATYEKLKRAGWSW